MSQDIEPVDRKISNFNTEVDSVESINKPK